MSEKKNLFSALFGKKKSSCCSLEISEEGDNCCNSKVECKDGDNMCNNDCCELQEEPKE